MTMATFVRRSGAPPERRSTIVLIVCSAFLLITALFAGASFSAKSVHANASPFYEWSAQSLPHVIGHDSADGRLTTTADGQGYMQYGPYTTSLTAGASTATWYLMVDNNTADNGSVVRLEVNDATTNTVLASQNITRQQWTATYSYQPFSVNFMLPTSGDSLEFRVWAYGISYVRELKVRIGTPPANTDTRAFTPGTLADYWNGNAQWNFWQSITATDLGTTSGALGHFDGTSMKVMPDGTWYLFSRKVYITPSVCQGTSLGTQVQKSTDHGVTWSTPVSIIVPTAGTAWECDATDGDAYYNATENKWHYLSQCLANTGGWNACEFEQTGSDPTAGGLFTPRSTSPVLTNGQLWHQICDSPSDDCVSLPGGTGKVGDEGTFDIFNYDGTYYWIAFHGAYYMGNYVGGVRGIAKTTDLGDGSKYIVNNPAQGVPSDAVLDANDANQHNWRENWITDAVSGSIGAGAGSILQQNGYYYLMAEFPDKSLGCLYGQNWDLGMFRSTSLTNLNWDQYPGGNPIIYSSHAPEGTGANEGQWLLCNVQYGHLFQDPTTGITYLMYTRHSLDPDYDGIYFYRLDKTENLLTNSDFWRADTSNWSTFGSTTTISASRLPNHSPDGTPYLLLQCGDSCSGDHSVYQDVTIPSGQSTFNYGGQFATDWGTGDSTGSLNLVIWQFDSSGAVITNTNNSRTVGGSYTSVNGQITLQPNTVKVRFQVYLYNTIQFRADNLYFEPA